MTETVQTAQTAHELPQTPTSQQATATTLYDLLRDVIADPKLEWEQKQGLIDEIRKASPASDRWTFRWAIWILGIVVILTIIALWVLSAYGHTIPDGLVAIGSGAAGGIAGLLTPGRENNT